MSHMRYALPGTELFDEIDSPKHGQFPDRARVYVFPVLTISPLNLPYNSQSCFQR